MVAVGIVYTGMIALLVGFISLVKPLRFLGIHNRLQATFVMGVALFVTNFGWALPTKEVRIAYPYTQLDQFVPVYQFHEFHSIRINAPRDKVYSALKQVTAKEIFLFRTLTWIRRFGRDSEEDILNPGETAPILEVATRTSFSLLAEKPEQEIVIGTLVLQPLDWPPGLEPRNPPAPEDFKTLHEPGFAIAAMNFVVEDAGNNTCRLTTETRVFAADGSAQRRFSAYWRTIYPGSALIRRMWLRAVKHRAES